MSYQAKLLKEITSSLGVQGCPTHAILDKIKLLKARIDTLELEKIESKKMLSMWSNQY